MYCGLHKQQGMVDVKHKRDRSHLAAGEGVALLSDRTSAGQPSAVFVHMHAAWEILHLAMI